MPDSTEVREVEVELRHDALHHAPHRLAEVGHEPHQVDRREPGGVRVPGVRGEQHRPFLRVELVVDREVGEVEERVAHARVLPVDDEETLAVVDEVRVEQVVVTGTGRLVGAQHGDAAREVVRPGERVGNHSSPLGGGVARLGEERFRLRACLLRRHLAAKQ